MRALRIFVNEIELDHVREDLKVREENSSFHDTLKAAHSSYPIRVVENEAALQALGEFSIAASSKRKFFTCVVVLGAIRHNGILTQLEKLKGFRKCDLKYGSEINGIMDKPIASFFPTLYLQGEIPFNAESDVEFNAMEQWRETMASIDKKVYPEAKWQLPKMRFTDKFGSDLKEDDSHYDYRGHINNRFLNTLAQNGFFTTQDVNIVLNYNVISPQVFVLSPLFHAFASLGYSLQGNVVKSDFFKRLLLLSHNDNTTKVLKRVTGTNYEITNLTQKNISGIIGPFPWPTYAQTFDHVTTSAGPFKIVLKFDMNNAVNDIFGVQALWQGELFGNFVNNTPDVYEEIFSFDVSPAQVGDILQFRFHSLKRNIPLSHTFEVIKDLPEKDFYDFHPTIDFSRYIPDWSVAEYLNNFQNLFNWKIDIDDVEKTVQLNFNEDDYLLNGPVVPIMKSLQIGSFKNIEYESYILKFENKEDSYQFISQDEIAENREGDENTKIMETKFKLVPHTGGTSNLSAQLEDKSGVGLLIYDPVNHPSTSKSYQGRNLNITGEGGIFESYWRRWLLFRLNAGNTTLKGPFSQTELYKISRAKKIYIDNHLWLVKSMDYKENSLTLFETEIEVESVTF